MLNVYSAYTLEVDDIDLAVGELFDKINPAVLKKTLSDW